MVLPQIINKSTVFPTTKSTLPDLQLSTSDLPMLSCHYIQKGNLFLRPSSPATTISDQLSLLREGLSKALTHFPPLAGRLTTDDNDYVYITCNDAGAQFIRAIATHITVDNVFNPLLTVQVTELEDGVFIGFSVNHAVVDGTSLWNFINVFAEVCRGAKLVSKPPAFRRIIVNLHSLSPPSSSTFIVSPTSKNWRFILKKPPFFVKSNIRTAESWVQEPLLHKNTNGPHG